MKAKASLQILIAILKHQVKKLSGESAWGVLGQEFVNLSGDELSTRLDGLFGDKALALELENAAKRADKCFKETCSDPDLAQWMVGLPLGDLPEIQAALAVLPDQPDERTLERALQRAVERDWQRLSSNQIAQAVEVYLRCLRMELMPVKTHTLLIIGRTAQRTEEKVNELRSRIDALIGVKIEDKAKETLLRDVRRIMKAKGYQIIQEHLEGADFLAEARGILGSRIVVAVWGEDTPVRLVQVRNLWEARRNYHSHLGLFITKSSFAQDARGFAQDQERLNYLKLHSYEEFVTHLVDFTQQIDQTIKTWEESSVSGLYIDLIASDWVGAEKKPVEVFVWQAAEPAQSGGVVLLGNFGTGKSTFCRYYAHKLAKIYRGDPVSRRIPIVIDLKEYQREPNLQRLIVGTLQRNRVSISHEESLEVQRNGQFLLLLDGFDEMKVGATKQDLRRSFLEIESVAASGDNFIVVTCRTHLFKEIVEERVFGEYPVFYLQDWGEPELNQYLQKRYKNGWKEAAGRIDSIHGARGLAKTPLFLDMLCQQLPKLRGKELNEARLYETIVSEWLEAQHYRSIMDRDQKERFMEELALEMYVEGQLTVAFAQLRNMLREIFQLSSQREISAYAHDITLCTFLHRDGLGNFSFAHTSFMEFFVAYRLAKEVRQGDSSNLGLFYWPYEISLFLRQLLNKDDAGRIIGILRKDDSNFNSRFQAVLLIGQLQLKEGREILINMSNQSDSDPKMLREVFISLALVGDEEAAFRYVELCRHEPKHADRNMKYTLYYFHNMKDATKALLRHLNEGKRPGDYYRTRKPLDVYTLGQVADLQALPHLYALIDDPSEDPRIVPIAEEAIRSIEERYADV